MKTWLQKRIDPICPLFAIIPLISCFALNMIVYSGTMVLCADWYHYDFTTSLDRAVPLVSEWMYIYFGCYLFWIANYILVARINRDKPSMFYRFVFTDMLSRIVCGVFYLLLPTTNIRPDIVVNNFSDWLLQFLYNVDQPTNLFPSIHCLVSWLCFVGIRRSKLVPNWYKAFSCIFALLVVLSTQFTKQHYWVDAVSGILFAEILYWIGQHVSAYRPLERFFTWFNRKLSLY